MAEYETPDPLGFMILVLALTVAAITLLASL